MALAIVIDLPIDAGVGPVAGRMRGHRACRSMKRACRSPTPGSLKLCSRWIRLRPRHRPARLQFGRLHSHSAACFVLDPCPATERASKSLTHIASFVQSISAVCTHANTHRKLHRHAMTLHPRGPSSLTISGGRLSEERTDRSTNQINIMSRGTIHRGTGVKYWWRMPSHATEQATRTIPEKPSQKANTW